MLRKIASVVAGASMLASSAAFAADTEMEAGALPPGNAAGLQQAQGMDTDLTMSILAAAVVVAGIVVLITSTGDGGHSTAPATPG